MTTNEKNAAISNAILSRVEAGSPLPAAIDAVLGDGQYAAIVEDVYRTLVARATVEQAYRNIGADAHLEIDGFDTMTPDQLSDELTYLADYQG